MIYVLAISVIVPCLAVLGWLAVEGVFKLEEAVWVYLRLREIYDWTAVEAYEGALVCAAWERSKLKFLGCYLALDGSQARDLVSRIRLKLSVG